MKKFLFIFALALFTTISAQAASKCPDETNLGLSQCAKTDFQKADQKLNKVYKKLLVVLKDFDDGNAEIIKATGWPGYSESLKNSQRAWIAFRDGECYLQTISEVGGSLRQISYPNCQYQMTKERTEELKAILECPASGECLVETITKTSLSK